MQFQGHFHTMFCCDDCARLEINQNHRGKKNIMKHCEILPDLKSILISRSLLCFMAYALEGNTFSSETISRKFPNKCFN